MFVLKNAWATISHHKGRSVLMALVALLASAFVIMSVAVVNLRDTTNQNYESQQVNAVISVDRDKVMKDKGVTDASKVDWTKYVMSITDYQKYYTALQQKGLSVNLYYDESVQVATTGKIKPANDDKGNLRLVAFSNEAAANDAPYGTFSVKSGEALYYDGTVTDTVLVSQKFADANSLKVGDSFTIANAADASATKEVKVGGIYENNAKVPTQSDSTADDPDNVIYTDLYTLMLSGMSSSASGVSDYDATAKDAYVMNVVWELGNPSDFDKFVSTLRDAGLGDDYTVSSPTIEDHEFAMDPLNKLADALRVAWIAVAVAGALIVLVCAALTVRKRSDEIGVLVAAGVSKGAVAWQMALETLIITVVTLALGIGLGALASAPASTAATKAVASSMAAQPEGANGQTGWVDPSDGVHEYGHTTDGVQDGRIVEIGAKPSGKVIGNVTAAAAGLAIVAAAIGIVRVAAFNPRTILLARDERDSDERDSDDRNDDGERESDDHGSDDHGSTASDDDAATGTDDKTDDDKTDDDKTEDQA